MHLSVVHHLVERLLDEVPDLRAGLEDPATARALEVRAHVRLVLHAAGRDEPVLLARLSGGPAPDRCLAVVSDVAGRWAVDLAARARDPHAPVPLVEPADLSAWATRELLDVTALGPELDLLLTDWPYEPPEHVAALLARHGRRPVRTVSLTGPYAAAL